MCFLSSYTILHGTSWWLQKYPWLGLTNVTIFQSVLTSKTEGKKAQKHTVYRQCSHFTSSQFILNLFPSMHTPPFPDFQLNMQMHRCTYAKCLERNNIKLSQRASHSHCVPPLLSKAFSAGELKSRDTLDSREVRWIGGFSPQKGDAYISTHNTANYFCASGSFSAANKSWSLKKNGRKPSARKKHWGGLREFFKALTKLNERRKWERGKKQLLSDNAPLLCLFSCGTKQGHIFSAKDNELYPWLCSLRRETKTTYMEVTLRHQLQRFFVSCFLSAEQWREKSNN